MKTKSFGSGDTFPHRAMFRSLLSSNSHSTPVDRRHPGSNTSAPASPRKSSSQSTRPQSTEFLRQKKDLSRPLELDFISDSFSVHSAPNSPMVPVNPLSFSYDAESEREGKFKSQEELDKVKEKMKKLNVLPCHSLHNELSVKSEYETSMNKPYDSITFLTSIKEMFLELFPNSLKQCDSVDRMEISLSSSNNFKKRSPLNLLDDFIKYGSDIHSYHLSRVPLTSQLDTDWTYYGGSTPVDELKILQTQVQLLSIQLQYERYKCELHCLRNRRLFGNLQKSKKDHDEVYSLKDQILLAEAKLQEMKLGLSFKCEENRQLKKHCSLREEEFMSKICKLEEENNKLEFKLKNHKTKKKEERMKVNSLEDELQKVKFQLFDVSQLYKGAQLKLGQLDHYEFVTEALQKEILLQYDKQEGLKSKLDQSVLRMEQHVDLENKITSLRNELKCTEDEKELLLQQTESLRLKVNELELLNSRKDSLIVEQKAYTKKLHLKHKNEIEAMESRLQSCVKASQSLQSYITCLYSKLEEPRASNILPALPTSTTHLNCIERCRKISYSGPGSMNQPSSHDQSHRHSFHNGENPFRTNKHSHSRNSVNEEVMEPSNEDSGISENSDMLSINSGNV